MKYAFGMGSGAMIHIPSFMKIVRLGVGAQAHRRQDDLISLLLFL
jgi:hypothetical protein